MGRLTNSRYANRRNLTFRTIFLRPSLYRLYTSEEASERSNSDDRRGLNSALESNQREDGYMCVRSIDDSCISSRNLEI